MPSLSTDPITPQSSHPFLGEISHPHFVFKNGKKYKVEEKIIHHDTAWKVWQGTQAFFLTIFSLGIGLAFQALRDKWSQAITGDEKTFVYTRFPPEMISTDKASQAGIKLRPTVASIPNPEVIPVSEKTAPVIENKELPESTRNFLNEARKDMTQILPAELEKGLNEALKAGNITDPNDKTTLLAVSSRVSQNYMNAYNLQKAAQVRMQTAQAISPAPPLANLHLTLQKAHSKLGVRLHPVDTSLFKGHAVGLQKRKYADGTTRLHLEAKLTHPAREQLQNTLNLFQYNTHQLLQALPKNFCNNITITTENVSYHGKTTVAGKKWEGNFSLSVPLDGFEVAAYHQCECQVIHFEGVGKVRIGNSPGYRAEFNRLTVDLDPHVSEEEAADKLNIIFAALNLGAIASSSREEDIERIKVMQLFRAYYPQQAYNFERNATTFEESVESLKARIATAVPDMKAKFNYYLEDHPEEMYQQEVYPGQPVWCIRGLAQEVRNAGGIGLMSGIVADNFDDAVGRAVAILKTGALSSQDRFQAGIMAKGASSAEDLKTGGGESVFVRMVSQKMSKDFSKYPLSGKMQILYDLSLVERVGYTYQNDEYGTKEEAKYKNRSNIVDTTKIIETKPNSCLSNEICIRNRVGPEFIKGIRVNNEDEKTKLISALRVEGLLTRNKLNQVCFNRIPIDQFVRVGDVKAEYWA